MAEKQQVLELVDSELDPEAEKHKDREGKEVRGIQSMTVKEGDR